MNDLLKIEYNKYLNGLRSKFSVQDAEYLSLPLLMHVYPNYLEADTKILFVGQETNGWEGKLNDEFKLQTEHLVKKYEKFEFGFGEHKYSSPIFRFMKRIYESFNTIPMLVGVQIIN